MDKNTIFNESDEIRYNYLIETAAQNKILFLLKAQDGLYAMMEDETGQEYIPVWPSEEHAAQFANEDWSEYIPEEVELFDFNSWLKELAEDEVMIAAFPNSPEKIIPVKALDIKSHLEQEYKRINS